MILKKQKLKATHHVERIYGKRNNLMASVSLSLLQSNIPYQNPALGIIMIISYYYLY